MSLTSVFPSPSPSTLAKNQWETPSGEGSPTEKGRGAGRPWEGRTESPPPPPAPQQDSGPGCGRPSTLLPCGGPPSAPSCPRPHPQRLQGRVRLSRLSGLLALLPGCGLREPSRLRLHGHPGPRAPPSLFSQGPQPSRQAPQGDRIRAVHVVKALSPNKVAGGHEFWGTVFNPNNQAARWGVDPCREGVGRAARGALTPTRP